MVLHKLLIIYCREPGGCGLHFTCSPQVGRMRTFRKRANYIWTQGRVDFSVRNQFQNQNRLSKCATDSIIDYESIFGLSRPPSGKSMEKNWFSKIQNRSTFYNCKPPISLTFSWIGPTLVDLELNNILLPIMDSLAHHNMNACRHSLPFTANFSWEEKDM